MKKEKKWFQKASNWVLIVGVLLLLPILLINLYIIINSHISPDEVPSVFGIKPFIVLSGSMEKEIYKGDLVITKVVDPKTLKVDDIIAFRDEQGTVTTHRIIELIENEGVNYFITKGDNNTSQDQNMVEYSDVEGIYLFRIPSIGNIMNTLSEPTTLIILLFLITMAFGVGFAISMKKERDLERKEFLEYKLKKEQEAQALSEKTEKSPSKKEK